jgi:hypothetical protein
MSPKEKAVLLVASMSFSKAKVADYETGQMVDVPGNIFAKQCALITVDEILEFMKMDDDYTETASNANSIWVNYFIEVKQEIEKL